MLHFFASHMLFGMISTQCRTSASHLFFRKYGERYLEITASFHSMQFKKLKDGGGCLVVLFVLVGLVVLVFLHFRDLLLHSLQLCERFFDN